MVGLGLLVLVASFVEALSSSEHNGPLVSTSSFLNSIEVNP